MSNHISYSLHLPAEGHLWVTEEEARVIRDRCDKIIEKATKPPEVQVSLMGRAQMKITEALCRFRNKPV